MPRPAGLEPAASCLEGNRRKSILLVRLVLFCVLVLGFSPLLAAIGPKLDLTFGGEPLSWHNFVGHSSALRVRTSAPRLYRPQAYSRIITIN